MTNTDLEQCVTRIVASLEATENPVEGGFVTPFYGGGEIKLIVIGQDPTVRNVRSRNNIKWTLNLDKGGALRSYIDGICKGLGISMENVYATNLFKYFYATPPASTPGVMRKHLQPNLELLKEELSELKLSEPCPIITLGEPVLRLLMNDELPAYRKKVRYYWDYNYRTKATGGHFKLVDGSDTRLGRQFFPFCHQPSLRKGFYQRTLPEFIEYVKHTSK